MTQEIKRQARNPAKAMSFEEKKKATILTWRKEQRRKDASFTKKGYKDTLAFSTSKQF